MIKGNAWIEFGSNTVASILEQDEDIGIVRMRSVPPGFRNKNKDREIAGTIDDNTEVLMYFTTAESLAGFIGTLNTLLEYMTEADDDKN